MLLVGTSTTCSLTTSNAADVPPSKPPLQDVHTRHLRAVHHDSIGTISHWRLGVDVIITKRQDYSCLDNM